MFYERYWSLKEGHLSDFELKWPTLIPLIPKDGGVVVDFGCGKGEILKEIKKINFKADFIGLDVSETALENARKILPDMRFEKIVDGGSFPIEDASIDFVFSSEVIEHVYDTENAFKELSRVLKPGGKILMTTPFHGLFKNLMLVSFAFDRHFNPKGPHVRFFSKKSLLNMFTDNGFKILKYGFYGRFFPFSHSIYVFAEKI